MTRPWTERLAGAPISWGVCEVPGWGHQLPIELVLAEMSALGLRASEFGPDGFLPDGGAARAAALAEHGLAAVGGFVPVVAHRADVDPLAGIETLLEDFVAAGAGTVVFAAVSGADGYDDRATLGAAEWDALCANLDALDAAAAAHGLTAALHPHVGTLVERPDEVDRVLAGSVIGLCLDTGHLVAGGTDPLELARRAADRVVHVHLKDVDADAAQRVRAGEVGYHEAVRTGMYTALGAGDARVGEVVAALEAVGYGGWYVLEQDRVLADDPAGEGASVEAIRADIRAGLDHLRAAVTT